MTFSAEEITTPLVCAGTLPVAKDRLGALNLLCVERRLKALREYGVNDFRPVVLRRNWRSELKIAKNDRELIAI